jgi:hypothetical protein
MLAAKASCGIAITLLHVQATVSTATMTGVYVLMQVSNILGETFTAVLTMTE